MNRPAASSEPHVDVARRPGDVPVLSWTKSEKNDKSNTFRPTSSLQKNHPAPAANIVVDNNERWR
jgi:hypothetical protein